MSGKIDTVEFTIHEEADFSKPLVVVQVKAECCGIPTKVENYLAGQSAFDKCCYIHLSTFEDVWNNQIFPEIEKPVQKPKYYNGLNCAYCTELYPFAVPNQPDGCLKCWSCRSSNVLTKMIK